MRGTFVRDCLCVWATILMYVIPSVMVQSYICYVTQSWRFSSCTCLLVWLQRPWIRSGSRPSRSPPKRGGLQSDSFRWPLWIIQEVEPVRRTALPLFFFFFCPNSSINPAAPPGVIQVLLLYVLRHTDDGKHSSVQKRLESKCRPAVQLLSSSIKAMDWPAPRVQVFFLFKWLTVPADAWRSAGRGVNHKGLGSSEGGRRVLPLPEQTSLWANPGVVFLNEHSHWITAPHLSPEWVSLLTFSLREVWRVNSIHSLFHFSKLNIYKNIYFLLVYTL